MDMADFDGLEDDYGDMFITQTLRNDNVVSLEEDESFKSVKCDQFSDISDFEGKAMEQQLRLV